MCFSNNLKHYRQQKQLTQRQVANLLGVAPSTYSQYESGVREPDVKKIKQLSRILDISADYLLFGCNKAPMAEYTNNLTKKEKEIIKAYNAHPEMQQAVDKMLDIKEHKPNKPTAAFHTNSTDDNSAVF